jgi:hypothetical protein
VIQKTIEELYKAMAEIGETNNEFLNFVKARCLMYVEILKGNTISEAEKIKICKEIVRVNN